jgi:hypothetical protein
MKYQSGCAGMLFGSHSNTCSKKTRAAIYFTAYSI